MYTWKKTVYIINLLTVSSSYDIEKNNDLLACPTVIDSHPEEGGDPKGVQVTVLRLYLVLSLVPLSLQSIKTSK